MKGKLLAMALGAAIALPAAAMAQPTVYGRAHVSLDFLTDGGDYAEPNVSSNSARLGFRAEKKTESGISGFMQIEGEVTYNQGNSALSSRDTYAGLKGNFGMVRLGQFDSPFKEARGPANLFGDQLGDMRNLTRVGNGRFDERPPNSVHYQTPRFNGMQLNLAYSVHEGTAARDNVKDAAVSASATYRKGTIDAAAAFEAYQEDASRGKRRAIRAAAGFDITKSFKVVGFFQTVDHDTDAHDADVFGAGGAVKLNDKTTFNGMFMMRRGDGDDTNANLIGAGVEHRFDRAVRIYANAATVMNDDRVALTPWNEGRSVAAVGAAGKNATGLSLGLRFDF